MRRRSVASRSRVAAACISRTTGGVATQRVLRIPWCRIRLRSVYSACSTASIEGCTIRAIADKNTLTGSDGVQGHQIVGDLRKVVSPVRGSSRCRSASLARLVDDALLSVDACRRSDLR